MQPEPKTVLECHLPSEPAARVFQLLDHGPAREPRFALRLSGSIIGARHVDLPLANARIERRGGGLSVASNSANGGASVQIEAVAGRDASSIDVFVNFELEVNVWRDLSPDVEHMNTHGLQANARCHVLSIPEGMP
jgi:hypothetical protein